MKKIDWKTLPSQHVANLHADGDIGFSKEYEAIQAAGTTEALTADHSQYPENKTKNRYLNIVACEYLVIQAAGTTEALTADHSQYPENKTKNRYLNIVASEYKRLKRALSSVRGLRGAPEVPPLSRETSVSRTANVGTVDFRTV